MPRLLKPGGEFPTAEALKAKRYIPGRRFTSGIRMVPADKVEAEKGRPRLTLVPLSLHTTDAKKDDLDHVTFVHHGDNVVACIEHRPDGSMALMVAEGAKGELQYGRGKMLKPGEIVEIPSSKGIFRHEINAVPPEAGSRGLQFGFTEVSSDGKKLRPRSYNYPNLPYAWHPGSR